MISITLWPVFFCQIVLYLKGLQDNVIGIEPFWSVGFSHAVYTIDILVR